MFAQLPERQMHVVRWVLTIGWLLVIASLFYDPWTAALTEPDHPWSPLRLVDECVQVQGRCVEQQPYPLGATLFWGAIVPSGIFVLLVFGHELWRRICPLSFLSQIPRALDKQRQFKRENQKTGKVRYELAKVKSDSWLGRNYPYVQFGWLFVGLCGRILFFNADRLVLGLWLVFTIVAAIAVGYYYGGKSWCQYFCPMAPVQTIFSEPRGLLGSKAHLSDQKITQSMCRTVESDGNEQSACVACQSPCIDIDSERTYWQSLNKPEKSLIRYGYVGLVIGYFLYYYLYAGNWNYYFSGVWNRDPNQLAALMSPGLYLFGQPINIPKLFAVPLVLGGFTAIGYYAGTAIERRIKSYHRRHHTNPDLDLIRHRIFVVCTFGIFNFFFFFAGRPLLQLMPLWIQGAFDIAIVFLSTLWLQKSWRRSSDLYSRENLASRFRKQLERLQLDVSQYLDGRSLDDLHTNEVYVLAKVLPGFTREKRHEAYKGVVREALEEGYADTSSSLAVLQQMRQELNISDDEHQQVLEELGVEDSELLNPMHKRSLENQIRLSGYRKSLERLIRLQQQQPDSGTFTASDEDSNPVRALRREYSITPQEEAWVLSGFASDAETPQKAEALLARLTQWTQCDRALHHPVLQAHPPILKLLRDGVQRKQELIVRSLLETLVSLKDHPSAMPIVQSLQQISPQLIAEMVSRDAWQTKLHPGIADLLMQPQGFQPALGEASTPDTMSHLENLLHHYSPLMQAAALYAIAQLDSQHAQTIAQKLANESPEMASTTLLHDAAKQLLSLPPNPPLSAFPTLEKLVHLSNSDFFHRLQTNTLMSLGDRAAIKTYAAGEAITEAGDTCRELLLLIEGDASIHDQGKNGHIESGQTESGQTENRMQIERLQPGQTLDELEVLTRSRSENTILAESERTRILAVPVDALDDLLDRDPDFARRILELESRQLQRLVNARGQV